MHPFLLATSWSPVLLVQHIIWCLRCKVWQLSKWKQSVFFSFVVHGQTLLPLSHYAEWRNEHSLFLPRPKFKPSSNCLIIQSKRMSIHYFWLWDYWSKFSISLEIHFGLVLCGTQPFIWRAPCESLVLIVLIQLLKSFGLRLWRMESPWCWHFKSFVTTVPLHDFEATWGLQVLSPQSDLSCFLGMGLLPEVHIWFHFCDSTSGSGKT
jgi:hypothetical protein